MHYVKIAEELDKISSELESQDQRLSLDLDFISDGLEASSGHSFPPRSIELNQDLIDNISIFLPVGVDSKKRREEICATKENLIKWLKDEGTVRRQMNYHSHWEDWMVEVADKIKSDKEYADKVFSLMRKKIDHLNKMYEDIAEKYKTEK